jgi:hypothetical protein
VKGKPKNWAALCKSVQAADVTAMPSQRRRGKLVDKLILNTLVQASNEFGTGARPGNAQLMKNAGVKWAQVHEHLKLLIGAKMIECTQVGNGAWNASVYRILYNHPVFPDHSENMREWFCIGGPDDSGPNHPVSDAPNHPVTQEKSSKPSGYEGANHPVTDAKPSGYEAENRRNHPVYEPEHILPLATPTPSAIPSNEKAGGGRLSSETLQRWQAKLPPPMSTEAMARHEQIIAEWAKSKGEKLATAFVKAWLDRRNIRGLNDLWGFFLKEHSLHEKEARAMTPEGRADEETEQKKAEAVFVQWHKEQFPDEVDEESPEEYFRRLRETVK